MQRDKGARIEREIVNAHQEIGVRAERYPLSGGTHFRGSGHDIDIYAFGVDEAPAVAEVKGRKDGSGFTMLERWIGEYDVLFLRRDRQEPLVVVPWRIWSRLIGGKHNAKGKPIAKTRRAPQPQEGEASP
jgi:Holliday junction resolvase